MPYNHPTGFCNWSIVSESLFYPETRVLGEKLVYSLKC